MPGVAQRQKQEQRGGRACTETREPQKGGSRLNLSAALTLPKQWHGGATIQHHGPWGCASTSHEAVQEGPCEAWGTDAPGWVGQEGSAETKGLKLPFGLSVGPSQIHTAWTLPAPTPANTGIQGSPEHPSPACTSLADSALLHANTHMLLPLPASVYPNLCPQDTGLPWGSMGPHSPALPQLLSQALPGLTNSPYPPSALKVTVRGGQGGGQ